MTKCPHCGFLHETTCPRIRSIEYHPDGVTVKRIEFHDQQPLHVGPPMSPTLPPYKVSYSGGLFPTISK